MVEQFNKETYRLVTLMPPQMSAERAYKREVPYIMDTSGSMSGPSIEILLSTVTEVRVVDSRHTRLALDGDEPRLTLLTCYPFDAIRPGGHCESG